MELSLPIVAGAISTSLFALGTLPMLTKALRTKNLASYSLGNLLLSNAGNFFHSFYVFQLPAGPIWILHSFYLLSSGLMLFWYLRYEGWSKRPRPSVHQTLQAIVGALCCCPRL